MDKTDPTGLAAGDADSGNSNVDVGNTCSRTGGSSCSGSYQISGTAQKTNGPNGQAHADASRYQLEEVARQAQARGEVINSAALNRSGTNGTDGEIVSSKRADSNLNTTSPDGTKNHYFNEALSKGQTSTGADGKWSSTVESAPEGHRVIVVAESVGSILSRAGKVVGAVGPFLGIASAVEAYHANPNMSALEFLYRAAGQYDLAVASGQLPPPPRRGGT